MPTAYLYVAKATPFLFFLIYYLLFINELHPKGAVSEVNIMSNTKKQTERLALGALFTALVIILQLIGSAIRLGPFSISLVLVPIVLGAALCGYKIGGFLGLVFGAAVLISGDAGAFLAVDVFGTVYDNILETVKKPAGSSKTGVTLEIGEDYMKLLETVIAEQTGETVDLSWFKNVNLELQAATVGSNSGLEIAAKLNNTTIVKLQAYIDMNDGLLHVGIPELNSQFLCFDIPSRPPGTKPQQRIYR